MTTVLARSLRRWCAHRGQSCCMWLWNRALDVMMWVERRMHKIDEVLEEMEASDEQA
jgi:hypothetical protein